VTRYYAYTSVTIKGHKWHTMHMLIIRIKYTVQNNAHGEEK